MSIEFPKDVEARLLASIKRYALESFEEELGDLRASLFLDFVLKTIAPSIYNQAIADAQAFMLRSIGDLEGTCYEPETDYWQDKPR